MPETPTDQSTPLTDSDTSHLPVGIDYNNVDIERLIVNAPEIGKGEEGVVYRVHLPTQSGERNFALKFLHPEVFTLADNLGVDYEQTYADLYMHAKEAGLPVMDFYQIVKSEGKVVGILMPDLSNGGKNFVFSPGDLFITTDSELAEGWKEGTDDPFAGNLNDHKQALLHALQSLDLSPQNPIFEQMYALAQQAAAAGILIDHEDGMLFSLTPQGQLTIFFPGELSSTSWGTFGEDDIWNEQVKGLNPFYHGKNLKVENLFNDNFNTILKSFSALYRYQQIKLGATGDAVHITRHTKPYLNAVRERFGLKPLLIA